MISFLFVLVLHNLITDSLFIDKHRIKKIIVYIDYFLFAVQYPVCGFEGMRCLGRYKSELLNNYHYSLQLFTFKWQINRYGSQLQSLHYQANEK
jgi:hypothetical protein